MTKRVLLLFVCSLFALLLGCSSEQDTMVDGNDQAPQTLMASFIISKNGQQDTIDYNSDDHLIFCKLTGSEMWIRLAEEKVANGENGPHIDIDICNYAGSGEYAPVDPQNRPCPSGPLWDIFWHENNQTFSNQESSSPCQLVLTVNQDILSGVFKCRDVIQFQGTDLIDITEGTFSCRIE